MSLAYTNRTHFLSEVPKHWTTNLTVQMLRGRSVEQERATRGSFRHKVIQTLCKNPKDRVLVHISHAQLVLGRQ